MSFSAYANYRDSRVESIGRVPAHWEVRQLRDIGRFMKGSGGSKEDIVEDGVPCVRYGDLYTTHSFIIRQSRTRVSREVADRYTPLRHGDVLFACSGETFEEIGKSAVCLIEGEAYCGGDIAILRPSVTVVPAFLGFATDSLASIQQKASMGRGTTVKHIYPDELRYLAIAVPPADEQYAIADFIQRETAKIDALVADQQRLIELLDEKRQAVISHAVTKGLNPDAPMRPSGVEWLGDVPEHWSVRRLKHVSPHVTVGIVVEPSKHYADEGVPALRSLNVRQGYIEAENMVFITPEANVLHAKSVLRAGDLVAVRTGQPGTAAVIRPELDGCNCIDLIIIRKPHAVSEWFLSWYLASDAARNQFAVGSGGAIQQHFNVSTALDLVIPIPPICEEERIVAFIQQQTVEIDALVAEADRALDLLAERRTALISAAVTGQIDVRRLVAAEVA